MSRERTAFLGYISMYLNTRKESELVISLLHQNRRYYIDYRNDRIMTNICTDKIWPECP